LEIYTCKKPTSVPQIHTCKLILVQMEDGKTIGQNAFVFDNIEQALSICHVCAYIYIYIYCHYLQDLGSILQNMFIYIHL
jgi:hypothetical protein